jgi:hypothetical protein
MISYLYTVSIPLPNQAINQPTDHLFYHRTYRCSLKQNRRLHLVDDSTTRLLQLYDSATIRLCNYTTLQLYDSASTTLQLYDYTTIRLYDYTTIRLYDYTTIRPYDHTTIQPYDHTTIRLIRVDSSLSSQLSIMNFNPCSSTRVRDSSRALPLL